MPDYVSEIGGIQTFSRFMLRALRDIFPSARIIVLSKNDTSFPDPATDLTTNFTPFGLWPRKLRTLAYSTELFCRGMLSRPQLIVTTHVNFAPVAFLLQKLFRIPFIAVGHGVEVWEIAKPSVRKTLPRANRLLAVSQYTRLRMAGALGICPDEIEILPNTFDPQAFREAAKPRFLFKRYGLRSEQPVILTIARLSSAERYKGYDQVLQALPEVKQALPNVRFILGGRGPDRPRVLTLITQLGLEEAVILPGYVPEYELNAHYNLCDVFAMPSKGEGFGIVFLEAMGCGKPVVAGNKDGSVDAVLNGKLGVLIDPDNVSEIAAAIIQVLRRTHPLSILYQPRELRRQVIEAYGYERFVERVRGVVKPLLAGERGANPKL